MMAFRVGKLFGISEKQAPGLEPGPLAPESSALTSWPLHLPRHKISSVYIEVKLRI